MPNYDPQMAARVWQRVRNTAPPTQDPALPATQTAPQLSQMIAHELAAATTYRHLSRQFQGSAGTTLRRMETEERSHASCLRGMCELQNGACPSAQAPTAPKEAPLVTLRRCYQHELQSAAQYEQLSADPQYGKVYASMAAQERNHSRLVLELLGRLKNSK